MSKHLQNDLEKLKRHILAIGALVEESVENATHAFCARDVDLAKKVIQDDEVVDAWEVNVEEECLKLLALYQPVAQDLRFIASTIKVNSDLERMGDYCVKISKRTLSLSKEAPIEIPDKIQRMIQLTKKWCVIHWMRFLAKMRHIPDRFACRMMKWMLCNAR
ncbi:MAG: phosphate signaling complex protein PhoU [Bdellovibrionota bacterium]